MLTNPQPHVFIFPRAGRTALKRANITDISSYNLRKTFATRLLSRGAAITDVQHLLWGMPLSRLLRGHMRHS